MYDAMVALGDAGINYWSMGLLDGGRAPLINHAFLARDGYFVMQVLRSHQWERLAGVLDEPTWLTDPDLGRPSDWFDHLEDVVRPAVERWASTRKQVRRGRSALPSRYRRRSGQHTRAMSSPIRI